MTANKKAQPKKASKAEATVIGTRTQENKVTKKFETVQLMSDGTTRFKCGYCGKWIVAESSIEMEAGSLCHHLRENMGLGDAEFKAKKYTKTDTKGMIKLSALGKLCEKHNIAVSKLVAAIGWDRGLEEPISEHFRPYYIGNARFVDEWCGTAAGLKAIAACNRKRGETKPTTVTAKSTTKPAAQKAAVAEVNALDAAIANAVTAPEPQAPAEELVWGETLDQEELQAQEVTA